MNNKELLAIIVGELSKDLNEGLEDLKAMPDDDWAEINKCMGYCVGVSHAIEFIRNIISAI